MPDQFEAQGICRKKLAILSAMIQNLDGKEMGGRALRVNEAQDKPRGGGGGGGGGGGRW